MKIYKSSKSIISNLSAHSKKSYYIFYKPYGVLSQFTSEAGYKSLADFGPFPKNIYPVGRLDADSEGLLIITNDNKIKHRLTNPKFEHPKTYIVQVEGIPTEEEINRLREGVTIEGKKTKPADAILLESDPNLAPRSTPIRFRKKIPTSFLQITIREGRNRQLRKMTAAIGHPTLRLVRTSILFLNLDGLKPGESRHLTNEEISKLHTLILHSQSK